MFNTTLRTILRRPSRYPTYTRRHFCHGHSPLGTTLPSRAAAQGSGGAGQKLPRSLFQVFPEVADAISMNRPVVALESTIITHGMPYPQNLSMAKEVGKIIRDHGAIPATVGVLDGQVHVGLSDESLDQLAQPNEEAVKTSRRDFAYVLSKGIMGGTTVSGTMIAAEKAGIPVFVTGGIGGVHRGAQQTFDISADLTELGRTPIAVICAGAKSILDIQLTLEYLETQGVSVATLGNTKDFPAFFTPSSGFESSCSVENPKEAAAMIDCSLSFGLRSGIVIAVPIPSEHSASGVEIEKAIKFSLEEASASGIVGKQITPYILQRVNELTEGRSLQANLALVKNNARVGSEIAVELAKLRTSKAMSRKAAPVKQRVVSPDKQLPIEDTFVHVPEVTAKPPRPVVIGGANVDFIATAKTIIPEASNPGKVRMSFGGVGRNIAEGLSRLDMKPVFISAIGGDPLGAMLLKHCEEFKLTTRGIHTAHTCQTGTYSAVMSEAGDFHAAVGDMDIHDKITPQLISAFEEPMKNAPLVVLDANVSAEGMQYILQFCSEHSIPVWFEPTCIMKAARPFESNAWHSITYASPNLKELRTISDTLVKCHNAHRHPRLGKDSEAVASSSDSTRPLDDVIDECLLLAQPLLAHIQCLVITLGKNGVLICRDTTADVPFPTAQRFSPFPDMHHGLVSAAHFPAPEADVINVTGAGDSLTAAMVASIIRGHAPEECVKLGLLASYHSLQSQDAIAQTLSSSAFTAGAVRDWAPWKPRTIDVSHLT